MTSKRDYPHRRWNPLTEEWILVSPHRTKRPWQGKHEKQNKEPLPQYDPNCYLCPGNLRANREKNPEYKSTFVFKNDFAALLNDNLEIEFNSLHGIIKEEPETGECRVVCFSPRHDLTLPDMQQDDVVNVINMWTDQYVDLSKNPEINHVQIFENKGDIMGCSNPHPHCQIWAQKTIPAIPEKEICNQKKYFEANKACMLLDYAKWEIEQKERIVCRNDSWLAVVPHWALWPYETLVLPLKPVSDLTELGTEMKNAWADIILRLTRKYDNLFEVSFPYSMGIHQKPTDGKDYPGIIMHQHFFPPLLRSATVKKFMVGYEMAAEPQRDIIPESAAEILRNLPEKSIKE